MTEQVVTTVLEFLLGLFLLVFGGFLIAIFVDSIRLSRRVRVVTATPPAPPVDAVAELVETKAEIRKDELRRWVEAWGRATGHGEADFWDIVHEIRQVEYVAVHADRKRQQALQEAEQRRAVEERQAAHWAAIEEQRAAAAAALAAEAAHQARLAARRARYAQRKRETT